MARSVTTGPVTARAVQLLAALLVSVCGVNPAAASVTFVEDFDRGMTSAARDARPGTPLSAALSQQLDDAVLAALPLAETPGVIVGVQTPHGTWKKGYGVADPATGAPMEPGMHTRIGSVTKTFTGTLLLQLAEAGRLSLDDTIDAYVEGIPNGDRITLRQLGSGSVIAHGPGEIAEFAGMLQRLLRQQQPFGQVGQACHVQVRTGDGAPAVGRVGGTGPDVLAGFGCWGAFVAPAIARWLSGAADPAESDWLGGRLVSRTAQDKPVSDLGAIS